MEQMIWVYVGMGVLFVFLIILSMDISSARYKIKKLDDIVYGLQTRLWGDWENTPLDRGDIGSINDRITVVCERVDLNHNEVTEALRPKPKAKKTQQTVTAKKR